MHGDEVLVDESDYIYIKIKISGLDKTMSKELKSLIDFSAFNYKLYASADEIRTTFDESLKLVASYLHSQGYYQAQLISRLDNDYTSWYAVYKITLGPRVIINYLKVDVIGSGKDFAPVKKYLTKLPIKSGDGFVHSRYEETKNTLLKMIIANGFLDAKLTQREVAIDKNHHTADISLEIITGERYFMGPISIKENNIDPDLIQKFVILKEGEPYLSKKILEQQNVLGDSDYYSEIYIKPRRDLAVDYKIPIEITTELRKPSKYSIGFGYSTDSGIRGSLGWSRRRLNFKGHRLYLGVEASKLGGIIGVRYRIPFRNPRDDEYVITTNLNLQKTTTSESRIAQLGLARSIMRGEWREILALDLQQELFSVGVQDNENINLLLPSATWIWVVPRRQLYITKGHLLSATVRGSKEVFLSSADFLQTDVNTKWIFPVFSRGRFLTRARLAASYVDSILDLPASFRYFTGGDQSVRGYSFASLGPKNSDGKVIGGKHLLVGSVEYDFRILKDWSVAVFYDVGNAFNNINKIDVATGVGIGIRWKTIIGQVRLDLASAISEPDNPIRIHVSIGPDL